MALGKGRINLNCCDWELGINTRETEIGDWEQPIETIEALESHFSKTKTGEEKWGVPRWD